MSGEKEEKGGEEEGGGPRAPQARQRQTSIIMRFLTCAGKGASLADRRTLFGVARFLSHAVLVRIECNGF